MSTDEAREKFIRSYLTEEEINRLIKEARDGVNYALPTYSQFYVGACILTHEGDYIMGCNIENISYTQTVHAEGCAISKAVAAGKKNFKAVAVYAKAENFDSFVPPCGECRQFLNEFANFLPIIMIHETGALMFEMLHEILPLSMVLGSTAPKADKATHSKYDNLTYRANKWILKDTYTPTRSEMRQLLRDWKFDEIEELTKEKIQFKEPGVVSGKFRAGDVSINYLNVQELFEAFAKAQSTYAGKFNVAFSGDNVAESLAHRIIATLSAHGKNVHLVKSAENGKTEEAHYTISVTSTGEGNTKEYQIKIVDEKGAPLSQELSNLVLKEREALLCSKTLNDTYDYNTNKLINVEKFVSA